MKNIIALSTLLLFFTAGTFGQSEDYQKFKFGIKLSPNVSWMKPKNNDISSEGSLLKAGFGLIADFHFTENYAIGTGVNISTNGGQLSYYDLWQEGETHYVVRRDRTYNLQNIEIPLTLKMRTNEIGYITYWGQFGVGLGAHIQGRADDVMEFLYESQSADPNGAYTDRSDKPGRTEEDVNIIDDDDLRLFRLSFIVGGGIEYNLGGSTSIVAGVTFNNGLLNILRGDFIVESDQGEPVFDSTNPPVAPNSTDLDAINNYFELNVGIMF